MTAKTPTCLKARVVTLGGDRRHIRRRNKADKYCLISFNDHEDVTFGNSCASLPGEGSTSDCDASAQYRAPVG